MTATVCACVCVHVCLCACMCVCVCVHVRLCTCMCASYRYVVETARQDHLPPTLTFIWQASLLSSYAVVCWIFSTKSHTSTAFGRPLGLFLRHSRAMDRSGWLLPMSLMCFWRRSTSEMVLGMPNFPFSCLGPGEGNLWQ